MGKGGFSYFGKGCYFRIVAVDLVDGLFVNASIWVTGFRFLTWTNMSIIVGVLVYKKTSCSFCTINLTVRSELFLLSS